MCLTDVAALPEQRPEMLERGDVLGVVLGGIVVGDDGGFQVAGHGRRVT